MHEEQYREIRTFLRRFVLRSKMIGGTEALCLIGIGLSALFGLGLAVNFLKGPLPYAPLLYSVLTGATLLVLTGFTLYRFLRPKRLEWAARIIEEKRPELRNNLINSLQLYPRLQTRPNGDQSSGPMILALIRQTHRQLAALNVRDLVDTARLRVASKVLAALAVPVLAIILWQPLLLNETVALVAHPLRDLPPAETFIDVVTRNVRVIRGTAVAIEAVTSGAEPDHVGLELRSAASSAEVTPEAEQVEMRPLQGDANRFRGEVSQVAEDLEYRVVAGPFSSPWYEIAAVDRPSVGDLKVRLYPPHYTGLPTETIRGGNIRGVKGSTLSFEVETNKEVVRARLVLDVGGEVPLKVTGQNAQGSMVLFRSQRYHVRLEDAFGFESLAIPYEMRAVPDGFPTVELLQPTQDLEVNGNETLSLDYLASDDYGVQEIALVAKVEGREDRIPVWRDEPDRNFRDQFSWDLNSLGLKEGDVVTYYLEVLDNDSISGPKLGKSRPLTLRLRNLKAEHERVADRLRELSDEMVDLLGDHLESIYPETPPAGEEAKAREAQPLAKGPEDEPLAKGLDKMMSRVDQVMEEIREDRMSDFATWSDLEQLKRNLDYTRNDLLKRMNEAPPGEEREIAQDEMSTELERMSMLSEDIGKRLTGQNLASTAQDMLKSQERLLDSLEKLRSGNKELDEVLKELSELSKQLQELQNSLAQFAQQAPDEFLNRESLRNMPFSDMQSAMREIRKKLEQGDLEAALQMARELFNQMAQMVASLRGNQQQAQSSMMGRMQSAMMRSNSELQQILQEQQSILRGTESTHKEAMQAIEEELGEAMAQFEARAREELASMADAFTEPLEELEESREGLSPDTEDARNQAQEPSLYPLFSAMQGMLDEGDFPALSKQMQLAQQEMNRRPPDSFGEDQRKAMAALEELSARLQTLRELAVPELTAEQKEAVRNLASRQSALESRTDNLTERLRNLFQLFPSLDPKILKNIEEAEGFMGDAKQELGALAPGTAIPPEEQAIQRLSQSNQQMQSAMQQLAQRGQMGRVPLVYMFRRGRFMPPGRLMPLPGTPQFPDFDLDQGITGLDTEKFKLPGKDDYQPEKFREEILDSLKQGVPSQFKEQIESYFKELTQ